MDSATHGINDARKFGPGARNTRLDQVLKMAGQCRKCAFLVRTHEPAIAGHIGRQDRRWSSLDALFGHH
jgi:hypothetical protein